MWVAKKPLFTPALHLSATLRPSRCSPPPPPIATAALPPPASPPRRRPPRAPPCSTRAARQRRAQASELEQGLQERHGGVGAEVEGLWCGLRGGGEDGGGGAVLGGEEASSLGCTRGVGGHSKGEVMQPLYCPLLGCTTLYSKQETSIVTLDFILYSVMKYTAIQLFTVQRYTLPLCWTVSQSVSQSCSHTSARGTRVAP